LKVYATLFITLLVAIILSSVLGSFIDALSGLSIPIIALIFLFGTIISLLVLKVPFKEGVKYFFKGVLGILPSILLIVLAGSIRLVLENGKVMDTIIHELSTALSGGSPILGILFVYFITLVIQFFIGSASAKIILIIPIISAIASNVGITQNIALLSFIFGDGFTDLIYITNPILLISLGVAGFSYGKWLKKTWLLQVIILVITTLLLILGHYIGY
ncbi:MAG TPA: Na+/H+ antiporter NhaC family protein, partial [Bacilli bacterium]|nr:Na+/H+ antiporter NhaC family protein [Bacilli bacterium]